ncbi:hypothetical protein [Nonomuraea basaltis]|uniref:hypothetical protein n=1 Tax=Nonomuraea basaltis TaxID=2495887 RepID=UPI00148736FE|nr:hypothetical protein [Nonomuraea basaltis]
MKVEVYGDIACPWCRLGTHQFHRAVATAGAEPDVELIVGVTSTEALGEALRQAGGR